MSSIATHSPIQISPNCIHPSQTMSPHFFRAQHQPSPYAYNQPIHIQHPFTQNTKMHSSHELLNGGYNILAHQQHLLSQCPKQSPDEPTAPELQELEEFASK
eukprot:TRINITY_DN10406_c0_g1_i10.p1 TRINITY_DN10406_c0_g1~~TRINITY_DN10406_c0_g1_i10.p1  ORF type:complete len:102 (-),score=21.43 TRINITY_DN10406_c0_g1_i10:85-390(-)